MALEEITKGMSNAAEVIDGNFKEISYLYDNTSWNTMNLINGATGIIRYRRFNGMIYIVGYFKGLAVRQNTQIGILPEGFRPKTQVNWRDSGIVGSAYPEQNSAAGYVSAFGGLSLVGTTSNALEFAVNISYAID